MEYAIWHVSLKNKSINILGIYHLLPKQHLTNAIFLDELTELLTTRLPNLENPIILGDFNMHIEALGLKQHINSTHTLQREHTRPHFHRNHISNKGKSTYHAQLYFRPLTHLCHHKC